MEAGGRIERPLAMGYEPMLGTSTLPASKWRPRRDSNSQIFRFEAGCLIRFGYGDEIGGSDRFRPCAPRASTRCSTN